ncbi:SDR family NAD(P)-dependent oxidoreductase [Pararhodobacter zhoushanensis]|uniref:SDR family NAD(P)-dependent oxidoreductase n=1 Tax=Pararhodobacter zhoushanensis TaxID=2479545 RepID=A0ABT3GYY3_9RHOB|nr:SDR family NAD(P)-dependent oxidoreductase [Pararhodobacter zhoushanensis]MCW1932737.1 SDR family NAD(P)-dependent oxidoreductase [Pararhodobacter zhoushanensis]
MSDPIRFDTRVAIVTGAGGGLGRAHALALAARGAKVVVNDVGNAQSVVDEIRAAGGEAMASAASVSDADAVQDMVARIIAQWGRIDILINNAGILRDKSFAKTPTDFFEAVIDVHLRGAWVCTQAVWEIMRAQGYGRVLMTTSSSGLYGNFGQANYSSAKLALVGLMNTLAIEGEKSGIRVNALAPAAMTQMTEALLPAGAADALGPEKVSPAALFLVSEGAPTKTILTAGAGVIAVARIEETPGLALGDAPDVDDVAAAWDALQAQPIHNPVRAAWEQTQKFVDMAKAKG